MTKHLSPSEESYGNVKEVTLAKSKITENKRALRKTLDHFMNHASTFSFCVVYTISWAVV